MSTIQYMQGRKKYSRPQAMLWANNPGNIIIDEDLESATYGQKFYIPLGSEIGSAVEDTAGNEFLILSDDNRSAIDFSPQRIETKQRMANGRMRSYHIADKLEISTSWDMLPSRSYALYQDFNTEGKSPYRGNNTLEFTKDAGAGGEEMLEWYRRYTGSFWVYLSYDKYNNFAIEGKDEKMQNLGKYSEVIEVFFNNFDYSIQKRGGTNHDFWNISVSLEEV